MNKVICDICGTAYPESAQSCPICGSSREYAQPREELSGGMPEYIPAGRKAGGLFSAGDKTPFYDFGEPDDEDSGEDAFLSQGDRPKPNLVIVILLTIAITLMLLGAGYLFFRYYLPNHLTEPTQETTQDTTAIETVEESTTEPTVPCRSIALTAGVPEIDRLGQYWLLHVIVTPENTTDKLTFVSSDESIVTVTEEGRLCAVGEGQTTVVISCGSEEIICPVTVRIPETEPPAQDTSEESGAESQSGEPGEASLTLEPGQEETAPPSTEAPQESTEETADGEIILRLKQKDLTFTKKGVTFQLELDCDLSPEDVDWLVLNSNVAICHDGVVTVLGNGNTKVIAQYQGQQAECIIRCNFK